MSMYVALAVAVTVGMIAGYVLARTAKPTRVRLSPQPPPGTTEALRLCVMGPAFTTEDFMVLDRVGRWTVEMVDDFADHEPVNAGMWVWEGDATSKAGEWRFAGTWRAPTAEEVGRLTSGKFPLRDAPLPLAEALVVFDEAETAK